MPKTRRLSDATLVRRSQQGDRRAFSALVGRYDWRLRGLSHALLLDGREMDAALGVAYLRAWRDVVRINAKDDVGAWLYRVTYNSCIDQLRRTGEPGATPESGAAPGSGGVGVGLSTLSAADRVAVVLVDREGFSPASAARILGLAPTVLDARLAAARERLTSFLPPPGPDGSDSPDTEAPDPVAAVPAEIDAAHGNGHDPDAPRPGADTPRDADDAAAGDAGAEPDGGSKSKVDGNGAGTQPSSEPVSSNGDNGAGDDAAGGSDDAGPTNGTAAETTAGDAEEPSTNGGGGGRGRRARRRAQHAATRPANGSTDRNGDAEP